jgi:hypothetical protein
MARIDIDDHQAVAHRQSNIRAREAAPPAPDLLLVSGCILHAMLSAWMLAYSRTLTPPTGTVPSTITVCSGKTR